MRFIYCFFLIAYLSPTLGVAQQFKPSVFATLSGYRHTGFQNNLFTDFELGMAASAKFWITPQISYKHGGGDLNDRTRYRQSSLVTILDREVRGSFNSNLFGGGVRIRLTKQEDFWLFFWPRYYGGNVEFTGEYIVGNKETNQLDLIETVTNKEFRSYLDFSLGYEGYLDDSESLVASIFLTYTTMQLKDGFEGLDFEQTEIRPASTGTNTLGLGFKIEYALW